ncbi:hypothetical protein LSAT2_009769 [Lamellibrachia satsuma]|nr:hypothetical protein LSAT2_009769 [Lamellibrachia satsuma]
MPADDSSSDEEVEKPAEPTPVLTTREPLVRVNELVTFAIRASDPAMLEAVTKVQNMQHDHRVRSILNRLKDAGMMLNASKCEFALQM